MEHLIHKKAGQILGTLFYAHYLKSQHVGLHSRPVRSLNVPQPGQCSLNITDLLGTAVSEQHLPAWGRVVQILNEFESCICGACFHQILVENGRPAAHNCAERHFERVHSGRNTVKPTHVHCIKKKNAHSN